MSARTVAEYEARLETYGIERSEEARAVRVGEKETSEQAAIVARYADLFTREQLEALHEAETAAEDGDREAIARLRLTCQDGLVTRELAEQEDALENALLAARVPWDGGELPLRSAQARLALEPEYARRDSLGDAVLAVSAAFDGERSALLSARDGLEADVTGIADPVARNEDEKRVSLRPVLDAVDRARVESTPAFTPERERWFDRLLGPRAGRDADLVAHGVDPPALATRGGLLEGAERRRLPRNPRAPRLRSRRRTRDPHRSR